MVRLTFVMPVYNAAEFIEKSISSLLKQTCRDWNLLCVDDGSTDNSKQIIESYAEKDDRISIICQQNQGPGVARANAFSIIKTEYVAILDADDTVSSDYVINMLKRADETNADIIMPDVKIIDENDNIISDKSHFVNNKLDEHLIISDPKISFDLSITWILHGWVMMKSSLARLVYTKDNVSFSKFNSDEFISRLCYAKANIVALCPCNYFYRKNENSLTRKKTVKHFDALLTYEHLVDLCLQLKTEMSTLNKVYSRFRSCLFEFIYLNKQYNNSKEGLLRSAYTYYKDNFSIKLWNYVDFPDKIKYLISLSGFSCLNIIACMRKLIFKIMNK